MNEEIKQILDKATPYLFGDEVDKLLDYITNLQKKYENAVAEEIDRLNNIIKQIEELCDKHELGKYDYSVPVFELKEVIKSEYRKHNK